MSTKIAGFKFSKSNKKEFDKFNKDFGNCGVELLKIIDSDITLKTAAGRLFETESPRAYPFLSSLYARFKAQINDNQEVPVSKPEPKPKPDTAVCEVPKKKKRKKRVEQPINMSDSPDVELVVHDHDLTDGKDDTFSITSVHRLTMFQALSMSLMATLKITPNSYLNLKNKLCVVRESLQTLFHANGYFSDVNATIDRDVFTVFMGNNEARKVSYLSVEDNDGRHTIVLVRYRRRYLAYTVEDFSEFVRKHVIGVKKGKSTVKASDIENFDIIVGMAKHTPKHKNKLNKNF